MATDHQLLIALGLAMDSLAWQVNQLTHDEWDASTPCEGWSVLDIVDHVVAGERFVVKIMSGASLADAVDQLSGLDRELDIDTRLHQLDEAADQALGAFQTDLDRLVDHRVGTITARLFLEYRIIDQIGHAWDIATATGRQLDLDSALVTLGLAIAQRERETLEHSDHFATTAADVIPAGDDLSAFLRILGRHPSESSAT